MYLFYYTEIQARVHYVGVCGTDIHYWKSGALFDQPLPSPMVVGHETTAVVTKVGPGVDNFNPGNSLYARLSNNMCSAAASKFKV